MEFSPVDDPIRQAMIKRLIKGKESLLQFLQKSGRPDGSGFDSEVAIEVDRSFSDAISMLSECESSQIAAGAGKPVAAVDRSSKGPELGKKRAGFKDRRGCYRRRNSAQSWVTIVPTTEDGYAWRKYGQKGILNTSFPRCYYRCTHKHDQQCKATRQVQRIQESPLVYQITYFGQHTCQSNTTLRAAHQIFSNSGDDPMASCNIMSFETNRIITPNNGKNTMRDDRDLHPTPQISDVTDNKSSWQHQKLEPSNTANSSGVCNHHNSFNDQEEVSGTTPLLRDHQMERLESFGIGSNSKFDDLDPFFMDDDVRFSQYFNTAEFLKG